ncbi:MAG: class I SAM-dependent methyltransferase [Bryobacterales bacterium]|nr:class I SAM-dependent methyltransferase [Bryobacterales bacterium]
MADLCATPARGAPGLRELIRRTLPPSLVLILAQLRRTVIRTTYTSPDHWRSRALRTTGSKVLWGNETYNRLFRQIQARFLQPYVERLPSHAHVLDVGCGVGDVSRLALSMRPDLSIDAVDLPEMIAAATRECPLPQITYIARKAEDFFDSSKAYHLVISSGCFGIIAEIPKLERAIRNIASMTAPEGVVIMMEPLHTWRYLARANYGSSQVIQLVSGLGFELIVRSGALFWPYQPWLTRSEVPASTVEARFAQGERLLSRLGTNKWADYQFLVFARSLQ